MTPPPPCRCGVVSMMSLSLTSIASIAHPLSRLDHGRIMDPASCRLHELNVSGRFHMYVGSVGRDVIDPPRQCGHGLIRVRGVESVTRAGLAGQPRLEPWSHVPRYDIDDAETSGALVNRNRL